jgi:hypothetical protein
MAIEKTPDEKSRPWFDGTKFRQDSRPFAVASRNYGEGGFSIRTSSNRLGISPKKLTLETQGSGKNLSYDGVNTNYWVVKGVITEKGTGRRFEGYHGIKLDPEKKLIDLVTPVLTGPHKQYVASEVVAKAFYNPEISAALSEAQGSSGEKKLKNWWSNYDRQQEEYDSIQKKGAFHFMNLTSGVQMKVLNKYAEDNGTDDLDDVLYSLFSQDGTTLFTYGAYVGPESQTEEQILESGQIHSKKTTAMIEAVKEAGVSQPIVKLNSDDLFYNLGYLDVDKKSKKVGPELQWTAKIHSQEAFGARTPSAELTSNSTIYVPKNTRANPVKFNAKTTFQFSRSYLIDVGTKKKQRITYKSRKAGDGLVVWKDKEVAKKAANAARSRGYLMRTVPVSSGWVNLAAKRKNYPKWHPLYSDHNKKLLATGNIPKNLREYHKR